MCTVTVRLEARSLRVTMNRDERIDRAPEIPPSIHPSSGGGPSWIAPIDGQAGGTWIGANDDGVVACLLNAYLPGDPISPPPAGAPSRGVIIPAILSRPEPEAWTWLREQFDPSPYPSFLIVVAGGGRGEVVRWTRGALEREPLRIGWNLITSSGVDPEAVAAWRRVRFEEWLAGGAVAPRGVPAFHLLDDPARREWSPWMTRSWSATRSLTQAWCDTSAGTVELRWWRRPGDGAVRPEAPDAARTLAVRLHR